MYKYAWQTIVYLYLQTGKSYMQKEKISGLALARPISKAKQ